MRHANPKLSFTERERSDLLKAWLMTSLAFGIFFSKSSLEGFTTIFIISLLTAGVGFIVHELCHKFAAHYFGVASEFIANKTMLFMSILFAFMGFIIAAPGAVHIRGAISKKENGIISAAGPASNLVLVLPFLLLALFTEGIVAGIGFYGVWINALLGAFNLIPFPGFDGSKVLAWNKVVYGSMVLCAGILVVLAFSL